MVEGYGVPHAQGTVRFGTSQDVPAVAALHSASIAEGFLSTLGSRFLGRLYSRIVESPRGFLLVADSPQRANDPDPQDDRTPGIAGFVAGSAEVSRLYREFLWRDGLAVALSSGVTLMASLPRVVENFRYGTRGAPVARPSANAIEQGEPETELLALAVDRSARRSGVGAALVNAFLASARASGSASARVVVGTENDGAIALYRRTGFRESSRLELHSGTESLLMRVHLSASPP